MVNPVEPHKFSHLGRQSLCHDDITQIRDVETWLQKKTPSLHEELWQLINIYIFNKNFSVQQIKDGKKITFQGLVENVVEQLVRFWRELYYLLNLY